MTGRDWSKLRHRGRPTESIVGEVIAPHLPSKHRPPRPSKAEARAKAEAAVRAYEARRTQPARPEPVEVPDDAQGVYAGRVLRGWVASTETGWAALDGDARLIGTFAKRAQAIAAVDALK